MLVLNIFFYVNCFCNTVICFNTVKSFKNFATITVTDKDYQIGNTPTPSEYRWPNIRPKSVGTAKSISISIFRSNLATVLLLRFSYRCCNDVVAAMLLLCCCCCGAAGSQRLKSCR